MLRIYTSKNLNQALQNSIADKGFQNVRGLMQSRKKGRIQRTRVFHVPIEVAHHNSMLDQIEFRHGSENLGVGNSL